MADALDSKSSARKGVRVRLPPLVLVAPVAAGILPADLDWRQASCLPIFLHPAPLGVTRLVRLCPPLGNAVKNFLSGKMGARSFPGPHRATHDSLGPEGAPHVSLGWRAQRSPR